MNQATGKAQEVYQQTKDTVLGQVCPGALLSCSRLSVLQKNVLEKSLGRRLFSKSAAARPVFVSFCGHSFTCVICRALAAAASRSCVHVCIGQLASRAACSERSEGISTRADQAVSVCYRGL